MIGVLQRALTSVSVVALAATTVVGATGAHASQLPPEKILCSNYDFSCDDSGYSAVAYQSHYTMAPGHNCTNYVSYRLKQDGFRSHVTWLRNAGFWADNARSKGIPVDKVPVVGAVAHWYPGSGGMSSAGHVAYVTAVSARAIIIIEDNYSSGPLQIRRIPRGSDRYPDTFIHFTGPRSLEAIKQKRRQAKKQRRIAAQTEGIDAASDPTVDEPGVKEWVAEVVGDWLGVKA